MTHKMVVTNPQHLNIGQVRGHVLQAGQHIVAEVHTDQLVSTGDTARVDVGQLGVVRDVDGGGDWQAGQAALLHLGQHVTVAQLGENEFVLNIFKIL